MRWCDNSAVGDRDIMGSTSVDSAPAFDASTGVKRGDSEVGVIACPIRRTVNDKQPAASERLRTCEEKESVHSAAPSPSERVANRTDELGTSPWTNAVPLAAQTCP